MIRKDRYRKMLQLINRASISKKQLAAAMLPTECATLESAQKTMQRAFRASEGLQQLMALLGYSKEQKHLTIAQALVMNAYLGGEADQRISEALCQFIQERFPQIIDECRRM